MLTSLFLLLTMLAHWFLFLAAAVSRPIPSPSSLLEHGGKRASARCVGWIEGRAMGRRDSGVHEHEPFAASSHVLTMLSHRSSAAKSDGLFVESSRRGVGARGTVAGLKVNCTRAV